MKFIFVVLAFCLIHTAPGATQAMDHTFDVTAYGAAGDGRTLDTMPIQRAVDACAKAGGGRVLVPAGSYISGPVSLRSRVDLHLAPGSIIKGVADLDAYTVEAEAVSGESQRAGVITARGARDVSITGRGVIDGSGMAFVDPDRIHYGVNPDLDKSATRQGEDYLHPRFGTQHGPLAHGERPGNLVRFIDCRNVVIRGVTIQNSPTWTVRVGYTGRDIRDCVFSNLAIHNSNRGLGVFVRGSGSVENILFSDIVIRTRLFTGHWWGSGEPIHVSAVLCDPGAETPGQIRGIRFRNILAESENGILVYGTAGSVIRDLVFEDVQLTVKNSPLNESYGGNIDLRSTRDLSKAVFQSDIPGLLCRYVRDLQIRNFKLSWAGDLPGFFTHGIFCHHFVDILIDGFCGRQAHPDSGRAAIALSTGAGVTVRNCKAQVGTGR